MKSNRVLLRVLFAVLTFCAAAWAQNTGSITGTVKDPTGASISGASVVISNADHGINRQTVTNSDGEYSETALPQGKYDVIVTATGFKKFQAKGVVLDVAQKARVDVALQVGAATTEVVVEGTAVAQVETESSELAGTVNGKEISQLELNGRNFTQLVTLTPGVSNQTGQDEGTVGVYGNVSFSMNGGRVEYNNWELDGGDNMDNGSNDTLNVYPSIDAISEFKVLTSNYGAQYGRNGSGTVEVETKSGTKAFHGDVYEFVRNDMFNSRNFFQSSTPEYKKNDYGYTFGGPVYIPKVYNTEKSKTFFFWSEEWRKDVVPGQTFNKIVPSDLERQGNFSVECTGATAGFQRIDPSTNKPTPWSDCPGTPTGPPGSGLWNPYPSDQIPFNSSDPNVAALLTMIPQANNGTNFTASPAQGTNWREELIRVDHNINDKVRATFRFIHDSWQTTTAVPLWTNQTSFPTIQTAFKGPGVGLVARLTATVSPTLLNEFVFSYTADHIILNDVGNWKRPSNLTMTEIFPGASKGVLPGINLVDDLGAEYGNFGEDAGYIPNGIYNSNPTYTFRDNVNKIIGRHNLQMGVYIAAAQKNEFGGELGAGSYPGYLTFDPSKDKVGTTTGNPFADLLLGNIYSFGQQNHLLKYFNRYKLFEPYFQDDWRITDRLTLNLGMRFSLFETYREKQHQAFNFDPNHYVQGQTSVNSDDTVNFLTVDGGTPSVTNLPNGIVQCGVTPGVPDGCMSSHWFNPAPRIGFAWDPKGDGKMAIRGGYGIFFEHTNGNEANTESLENSPPLATVVSRLQIAGYPNIGTGAVSTTQFPLGVNAIPTKARWPYIQQWHFDIQREVTRNTVATVSYVGSKGTRLTRQSNYNQLYPTPPSQNPYKAGEAIGPNDCATGTTPSGVPITGQAAINFSIFCGAAIPDPIRPYPGYGTITHIEEEASSIYHALQTSVRRNVGQLTLSAAYSYSHSIDDSSDRSDNTFVNAYDFPANRGNSNFDQRHVFTLSYVWDIPLFKGRGIANKALGGWEYSGLVSIASGSPFTPVFNADNAGVANGVAGSAARPDLIGDPHSGVVQTFLQGFSALVANPAAYAAPQGLTFGDAGRNTLNNPRHTNFDMALFKHFPIHESVAFEFRAEAFNVFNHVEWGALAGGSGSGANAVNSGTNIFGQGNFLYIGAVHNARILQLGAKLLF